MTDIHNHPHTQGYKEAEMTDIENRDQRKQVPFANIVTDTNLVQIAKLSAAALDSSIASINRLTIPRETQESLFQAVSATGLGCQPEQNSDSTATNYLYTRNATQFNVDHLNIEHDSPFAYPTNFTCNLKQL